MKKSTQENLMQLQSEAAQGQLFLKYEAVPVEGECILLKISPIRFVTWRFVLFVLSNIFIGIPWFITYWYPHVKRIFYYAYCELNQATDFQILNYDEQYSIVPKSQKVFMINQMESRFYTCFVNRYMTYMIDDTNTVRVSMYDYNQRIRKIATQNKLEEGLTYSQAYQLESTYGPGTMVIQKPHCVDITIREILRPLYIFLIFSVCYWTFLQKYFYFAGTLFFISLVGLIINLVQTLQLNNKIFSMAYYQIQVNALRQGKVRSISSLDIVPGDIVFLKQAIKIPFEGIILEGSALINECALTGESVPIVKKADTFQRMAKPGNQVDKNAFIFEGTTIVQVNNQKKMSRFESFREAYGIPVCVVRTNFVTTKGQLIRIILFPKEQENNFQRQSTKYLIFLFFLALATFIVLVILIREYVPAKKLVQQFFDLITITIPPALPVSMTFGIIYAVGKLQNKKIFCIAQNKVIVGGLIQFCCFDKTGTLTQDFMDFYSLVPAQGSKFEPAIVNNPAQGADFIQKSKSTQYYQNILANMAANHSLIMIEATGELVGDPMEVKIFEFGEFRLNQSNADPNVIFGFESQRGQSGQVFRRFEFDSDVQRMSVVCKSNSTGKCNVLAKGSPEMMLTIMRPDSIPRNYNEVLKEYASTGFRVLAIASKPISESKMMTMNRAEAQQGLLFNGFQVFQNKLKPQTKDAIRCLRQQAQIDCVMITGDNTLTGSNISYQCGISDKSKGMIICDYVDGTYTQQNFDYKHQGDNHEPNTEKQMSRQPSQIQLVTVDFEKNKKVVNAMDSPNNNTHNDAKGNNYMQDIIQKAEQTNCQLCVTGRAFNSLFPGQLQDLTDLQRQFMRKATVFARTKPNDKAKIVMAYQHMDLKVSMCGDGANDCGALKQADIGLSLSQAEASISAPFCSQITNISSMVQLLLECRAGLATNFSLFNIMATYALTQYTTTVLVQRFLQYPGDFQYLQWDLYNFGFILVIGYTATAQKLSVQRPRGSLFCFTNLLQVLVAFVTQVAGQISVIALYERVNYEVYWALGGMQNAITAFNSEGDFSQFLLEGDTIFLFVNNIYLALMLAFSIAKPWRAYFFTNIPLMIIIIFVVFWNFFLLLYGTSGLDELYVHANFPTMEIRWAIFGFSVGLSVLIYINQKLFLEPLCGYLIKTYPQKKWL